MTSIYESSQPCARCGTSARYLTNRKCVVCMAAYGKAHFQRELDKRGNLKVGLREGFVRFDTTAHKILVHLHETGPCTHREITEDLKVLDASTVLRRLQNHGFVFRIARRQSVETARSGGVFSLTRNRAKSDQPLTPSERGYLYRARKKRKVASVFDFRGTIQLCG